MPKDVRCAKFMRRRRGRRRHSRVRASHLDSTRLTPIILSGLTVRIVFLLALACIPATAQSPVVRLTNTTRPAASEFQIGDQYEIVIAAAAGRPVSVRTTMNARRDWGPVIASTDMNGRWSTAGRFEKGDFGEWSEIWTVGGKLATPAIHFSVSLPCLGGGQGYMSQSGLNKAEACETPEGWQSVGTHYEEPFRTPDGRVVPGRVRANDTAEQLRADFIQDFVAGAGKEIRIKQMGVGDESGNRILKLIGVNALSEEETRKVLSIIQAAFEKPESLPPGAREASRTSLLLRQLADSTDQEGLKQQIAETMAYVQAQ